ncbi:MAG TPA: ATP-binding protein [Ktedonobacteraceae bacterium]|nr:ATP-binding protein [Ktedonobacteraceae bacterium]
MLAETNIIETGIKSLPNVVRTAVIYGPNASGKSNVVRAIQFMRGVVLESASLQLGQTFRVQPFRLDPVTATEPTELEITFLFQGVRYQYGFSVTPERITSEWLFAYPTAKAQKRFLREYDSQSGKDIYSFGSHLSGQRRLWQEATKQNSLYLSTAVQLNSEQLKEIFEWISTNLVIFPDGLIPSFEYTISHMRNNVNNTVKDFLGEADISIDHILIDNKKAITQAFNVNFDTGELNSIHEEKDVYMPTFRHVTQRGSAVFELEDESGGTQKLFAFAGPLFEILSNGRVLVVDELDRSLHPLLVRQLVAMFQDPEINVHGAQLIFTTHNTTFLDSGLLRRDQIWFTEKDNDQASTLFPLTEFAPRKNEALERGYLSGRYGAVPILKKNEGIGF